MVVTEPGAKHISVIVAVYNDPRVARALDSVLFQRSAGGRLRTDVEIIVVDDSDDGVTGDLLAAYGDRITVVRPAERQGLYHARNIGVSLSTGAIIAFLNADDYYVDDTVLSDVVDAFAQPDCRGATPSMVYGYIRMVYASGRERKWIRDRFGNWQSWPRQLWPFGYGPRDPAVFWRWEVLEEFGPYRLDLPVAADTEFLMRSVYRGNTRYRRVDRVLTNMEVGGMSYVASWTQALSLSREHAGALRMHGLGPTWLFVAYGLARFLASRALRGLASLAPQRNRIWILRK